MRDSTWKLNALILKIIGFETCSKWTPDEFVEMIGQNGFTVTSSRVLKAAFPLVYLEAVKSRDGFPACKPVEWKKQIVLEEAYES